MSSSQIVEIEQTFLKTQFDGLTIEVLRLCLASERGEEEEEEKEEEEDEEDEVLGGRGKRRRRRRRRSKRKMRFLEDLPDKWRGGWLWSKEEQTDGRPCDHARLGRGTSIEKRIGVYGGGV